MPEYRRFVAYFYEYIDGKKQGNAGFAKVELRNGMWRILFRLTSVSNPEPPVQVYGFVRERGYLLGMRMGTMRSGSVMMEEWAYRAGTPLWHQKYGVSDLAGIWIQTGAGNCYVTLWDDMPIDTDKFVLELPADDSGEMAAERKENRTEPIRDARKEAAAVHSEGEVAAKSAEGHSEKKVGEDEKIPPASAEFEVSEKPDTWLEEEKSAAQQSSDMKGEQEAEEHPGVVAATEKAVEEHPGIVAAAEEASEEHPGIVAAAEEAVEEQSGITAVAGEQSGITAVAGEQSGITAAVEEAGGGVEKQSGTGKTGERLNFGLSGQEAAECAVFGNTATDQLDPVASVSADQAPSAVRVSVAEQPSPEVKAAEAAAMSQRELRMQQMQRCRENLWRELSGSRQHFMPFGDETFRDCIQIRPCDLIRLQQAGLQAGRSSFLLHGFYQYHHLLLGVTENGDVVIGVPGLLNPQERYMAQMFGFGSFKMAARKDCNRQFGYWQRTLQPGLQPGSV